MNQDRRCILCPTVDREGNPREKNWPAERSQACTGHAERLYRALEVAPWQTAILSAAPGSNTGQARVSGSAEPPLGVRVSVLNLMGPANTGTVHDEYGDQNGTVSVATVLDMWCSDWADLRGKGEQRPVPTVDRLAEWLSKRLDWALAEHPALEDFAHDLHRTIAALKAANGDLPAENEHKDGVECPGCDRMTLYDIPEHDFIECVEPKGCGKLLKPTEYYQWVRMKEYFLRTAIPCPACGVCALTGGKKLGRSECITAKGGCGAVLEWGAYESWAKGVAAVEKAGLWVWGEHHPLPGPSYQQAA